MNSILSALTPALWMLIPAVAFVLLQLFKRAITPLDNAGTLVKQLVATAFAFVATLIASKTGIPVPPDLAGVDQSVLEQVLTWVLTSVVGGTSAAGLHAATKAME